MTEAEAKTKWCPLARNGGSGIAAAFNRWNSIPEEQCIGSECMAWRWSVNDNGYCGAFGREEVRRG